MSKDSRSYSSSRGVLNVGEDALNSVQLEDWLRLLRHNKPLKDEPETPKSRNINDIEMTPTQDSETALELAAQGSMARVRDDLSNLETPPLDLGQEAISPDEYEKPSHLQGLAASFIDLYRRRNNLKDLDMALELGQEAVKLTATDDPRRPWLLQSLAVSLDERYKRLYDPKDLEAAIEVKQEVLTLTSRDDPQTADHLQSLAFSLTARYHKFFDLKDLETALEHEQNALKLTPAGSPRRPEHLQRVAVILSAQYRRLGDVKVMREALELGQEAVNLTSIDHAMRPKYLDSLCVSFGALYQRLGAVKDLEAALEYGCEALKLTPEDHPQRTDRLQTLAVLMGERYQRLGDEKDFDTAMEFGQEALRLSPMDWNSGHLQKIVLSLTDQHHKLGELKDLETALKLRQEALKFTSEKHPQRPHYFSSLAVTLTDQYHRLGDLLDLEAALQEHEEALKLTPINDPRRPERLDNVAKSLLSRHERLARSLSDQYKTLGDPKDLGEALELQREAVDLTPMDDPDRSVCLQSLATSLSDRYEKFGDIEDLKLVYVNYKQSFECTLANPDSSWHAALRWAAFSRAYQPEHYPTACAAAFNLLPEILWMGHSISVRQKAIQRVNIEDTTSAATSTCIKIGNATAAVEFLEQGLAMIFQQMLQLKTDVDMLPPSKGQAFADLSAQIYTGGGKNLSKAVEDRTTLLKEIRSQPGLEYFLLPKPYRELCKASRGGPIVILNSHEDSCNGILILSPSSDPITLRLQVTLQQLQDQRSRLKKLLGRCGVRAREATSNRLFGRQEQWSSKSAEEQWEDLLTWLWIHIVNPVYQVLQSYGIVNGRIWWLLTGAFASLPLHACPPTDVFVHSYTATLGSLIQAQTKECSHVPVKVCLIGLSQTNSSGENYLNSCVKLLEGKQATQGAVQTQLQSSSWLHLACHGKQDLLEPTKSRLLLYESTLDMETILRMPLDHAEVVFLAACQTAMGDSQLVNESFHLGGGFIAAGCRGAIGTLWSMNDQDGPLVAKTFYAYLFKNDRQPQAAEAAQALHFAVKELKKQGVPHERWIPFIHMGI
ncbi:CHAT domain-containing protein [Mycena pura]|uniref:CHAT domain-containing protein n=1 Tax=Mycena pura TaxID=153505 RepID=A0AAD7E5T0_9AGAR|nr:CHAT domain-containing protein [Mycena pura]